MTEPILDLSYIRYRAWESEEEPPAPEDASGALDLSVIRYRSRQSEEIEE